LLASIQYTSFEHIVMNRLLLVLDLDETLVHATSPPLGRPCDFMTEEFFVYVRPGLTEFLEGIVNDFEVAVWTSSSEAYARQFTQRAFGGR